VLLVCVVFPLIWVGGLVTSYNAGMAVPDWPTTYGYNMFLYPIETWLFGPWDLFIEHGHRLLGALAGLITIGLVIAAFRCRTSIGFRWAALAALALVIAQGSLGGARVIFNDRQLAMIHGCTGPLFFAWCVGLAVASSATWRRAATVARRVSEGGILARRASEGALSEKIKRLSCLTLALAYLQLILGAQLRHAPATLDPQSFRVLVFAHLVGALALAAHIGALALAVRGREKDLARPAMVLLALIVFQLSLGAGAWVVNYAWPEWSRWGGHGAGYTILAEGWLQTNIVTAHVAVGSLILGVCTVLAMRAWRAAPAAIVAVAGGAIWKGAAA
jgi:cytochrome c oxidase assembly protein subunit 15